VRPPVLNPQAPFQPQQRAQSKLISAQRTVSILPIYPYHGIVLIQEPGIAEMVTYLPISSPFIRFAGRYVDDAFGVAAGWNFFVFEAALVPFEIVACNVIIGFWSNIVPTGAIIAIVIVLYGYALTPTSTKLFYMFWLNLT
jgi:amino acid permease